MRALGQFEEGMVVTQEEYAIKAQACFHIPCENDLSLVMPPLYNPRLRGVAQPGSVRAWGARGRRFESSRPDQFGSTGYVIVEHEFQV
jgi:hypothetical protein